MTHPQHTDEAGNPFPDPTTPTPPRPSFLSLVGTLLEGNLQGAVTVDWLADQLAVNRKTLYRKVIQLTYLSPAGLIRQYRLRKAIELLQAGHSITATARQTGFATASHFAAVFKKNFGQTPSRFMADQRKSPA